MRLLDRIDRRLTARKPGRVLKNMTYPSMRAKRAFLRTLREGAVCVRCGAEGSRAALRFREPKGYHKTGKPPLYTLIQNPKATLEDLGDLALECLVSCFRCRWFVGARKRPPK